MGGLVEAVDRWGRATISTPSTAVQEMPGPRKTCSAQGLAIPGIRAYAYEFVSIRQRGRTGTSAECRANEKAPLLLGLALASPSTLVVGRLVGAAAAQQALSLVRDGRVRSHDGSFVSIEADTLCVHGDTPGAPAILRAVRAALVADGIALRAFVR